jgi:hypothetical protein
MPASNPPLNDAAETQKNLALLRRPWLRSVGIVLGVALLTAALVTVVRQHDTLARALGAVRQLPLAQRSGLIAMLIGSVVLNVLLSGALFSVLMSPHGRVGHLEMQSLIAATALMNYLPVPGFVGRIAYHKTVNHIAVRDSARIVLQAMALSMVVAAWFALAIAFTVRANVSLAIPVAAPVPVLLLGSLAMSSRRRIFVWALLIRYVDALATAIRYVAAFSLIGSPIGVNGALAFAGVSMIATMVPFLSNGLGLREWAIGLAAPLLTGYQMELGITADLVNRAAEMLVFVVMGLAGLVFLARLKRAR